MSDTDACPGMGQDTSCCGCNQPCDDPIAAGSSFSLPAPPSPATLHHYGPHVPSNEPLPHTAATTSLLEHLQPAANGKENHTAHSYREDFLRPVPVPAQQARTQVPHIASPSSWTGEDNSSICSSSHQSSSRAKWLQQPLQPVLLNPLITGEVFLAACDCEQAEDEDEHDGQ